MNSTIEYKEYAYLMNRIAYWLVSNSKKFSTRDVYGFNCGTVDWDTIIKTIREMGTDYQSNGLIAEFVECVIRDNSKDTTFLPNSVTGSNNVVYYKDCYIDMANRVSSFEVIEGRSPRWFQFRMIQQLQQIPLLL